METFQKWKAHEKEEREVVEAKNDFLFLFSINTL